jgi:ATP-binding cassette subfamily B (MDR/TAP) protein 1
MIAVFYDTDTDEMRIKSYWYAAAWTGLGIAQCLFAWIQYGGFGAAGQSLTRKLREASFTALLAQEVAYFDEEVNKTV